VKRRAALAAGLAGALSPFVQRLGVASAEEPRDALERFVAIYAPHGVAREFFTPRAGFDIAFEGSVLAAFDDGAASGGSLRSELLVIEGLDLTAGIRGASSAHEGSRVLLTGSGRDGTNASLEQYLALERGLGALTPVPTLVLGVGDESAATATTMSFAAGGVPLPKLIDPSATYHAVVGQWVVADDAARVRLERERRLGKSVLDTLRADLASLRERLGAAERRKLEQHETSLRALETRLSGFELACTPPEAPDPTRFPRVHAYGGGEPYFDAITDLQSDLVVIALACGVTRFATLYLADLSRTGLDSELPEDVHLDVAHRYRAAGSDAPSEPATWELLARQNRYAYGKVARLCARLRDADLLDDTLVLATSDMGDPARHDSRNVPTLLVGGRNAGFSPGRAIDAHRGAEGVPNNRLLVSLAQAFGDEIDAFGEARDPAIVTGTLEALRDA